MNRKKVRTAMVFGTFDFLHIGHQHFFAFAHGLADRLMVVIARDETVAKTKKRKPIFSERERRDLVRQLRIVDEALLGLDYFRDKTEIILEHNPDIVVLGYDQPIDMRALKKELYEKGWRGIIRRAAPYRAPTAKTSRIKRRILGQN